jgi:hypothetical protein
MPRRHDRSPHRGKNPLKTPDLRLLFQIHLFLRQRIPSQILSILTQQAGAWPGQAEYRSSHRAWITLYHMTSLTISQSMWYAI